MKQQVSTDEAPELPGLISQAIVSNGFIFVAGQIHNTPDNVMINSSTRDKLAQIMTNITTILKAANAALDDVVKVTIYITDMLQMSEINELYPTYFTAPFPARETVCVVALPAGATIEISVVAAVK